MVSRRQHTDQVYGSVPRAWVGETVVCLASGPSLTQADVDACHGLKVIAIKDCIRLAPRAAALYACDAKWWRAHPETASYAGPKYALEHEPSRPDVTLLRNTGMVGLETAGGLRTGQNSGYQAINLAVLYGAARILLLGYDMQPDGGRHHWFGAHPYAASAPPYDYFLRFFDTIVEPLKAAGVEVLNCTRRTALTVFPQVALEHALEQVPA